LVILGFGRGLEPKAICFSTAEGNPRVVSAKFKFHKDRFLDCFTIVRSDNPPLCDFLIFLDIIFKREDIWQK